MGRFIATHFDQTQLIPVTLANQLCPGSFEWAIHYIIEERVDLQAFFDRYQNDECGRIAYNPKVLLKIILFGYARGVISSRTLERACRENIVFMALSCGQCPDHSTIAAFISGMGPLAEKLFVEVLLICEEEGLLSGTHLSVDGTKLSSNASKEWSGTFSDLEKKKDAIREKVQDVMTEHETHDALPEDESLEFRKRIQKLNRSADRIEEFLAAAEPRIGAQKKEIQSNVTDNESAKMSTSHGVRQGYNANALVDEQHQVIVAAEAFGRGGDERNLGPILEKGQANLQSIGHAESLEGITVSADTSYFSGTNLASCDEFNIDAYIPDPLFRKRDVRFEDASRHRRKTILKPKKEKAPKKKLFKNTDFEIDEETDKLRCPAGKLLHNGGRRVVKRGKYYRNFCSTESMCKDCPLRAQCIRKPEGKIRQVCIPTGEEFVTTSQRMIKKIDTPEGRATYSKRLGIVEPVFANICTHKGMDVLRHRGYEKVNIQWTLYYMVHNIGKIARYGSPNKAA
ncbi:MAG: IS1182 family transposase [Planctomycetes bacterium]|nr:IS1182 family transposase [Planctomycetota bacterium]